MQDRRRLSVVSANPLVEGQQQRSDSHDDRRSGSMGARGDDKRGAGGEVRLGGRRGAGNVCGTVVIEYAGVSLKGYAPYNMKKENQDILIMKEHPTTDSIFFSVMDGHGEVGHWVSRHFERMLPSLVTQHREYSTNPANAMAEMLLQEEQTVMNNRSIDTSLSGSTAVLCTSRSVFMF